MSVGRACVPCFYPVFVFLFLAWWCFMLKSSVSWFSLCFNFKHALLLSGRSVYVTIYQTWESLQEQGMGDCVITALVFLQHNYWPSSGEWGITWERTLKIHESHHLSYILGYQVLTVPSDIHSRVVSHQFTSQFMWLWLPVVGLNDYKPPLGWMARQLQYYYNFPSVLNVIC